MIELNKDGLAASEGWMQHQSATFGLHWKNAKPIIEAYFDTIHESDAPALALAILEAAGVEATDPASKQVRFGIPEHLGHIAFELRRYAEWEVKRTAEAEAQAKLEAEALEFLHVAQKHNNIPLTESWDGFMDGGTKLLYVNMARRAREMRAEK